MTDTTKPEALRLAELLDGDKSAHHEEAAAELRRLHEVNAELLETLKSAQKIIGFGREWYQIAAAISKAEVTK
jgi:hypothetical protein